MIIVYYLEKNLEHSAHGECKFYFKFKAFYLFIYFFFRLQILRILIYNISLYLKYMCFYMS